MSLIVDIYQLRDPITMVMQHIREDMDNVFLNASKAPSTTPYQFSIGRRQTYQFLNHPDRDPKQWIRNMCIVQSDFLNYSDSDSTENLNAPTTYEAITFV